MSKCQLFNAVNNVKYYVYNQERHKQKNRVNLSISSPLTYCQEPEMGLYTYIMRTEVVD